MTGSTPQTIAATILPGDDAVLPFQTDDPGIKGRLVRLGACVDTILKRHAYPDKVSEVLAQAIALTGMLGASLPVGGKLSLQARTDGPVSFIFVDLEAGGMVRATASFNAARVSEVSRTGAGQSQGPLLAQSASLLGLGHMALTVEPGEGLERTQGIIALDGGNLTQAAQAYFRQSEQLPTYIRLAVAKHYVAGASAGGAAWSWRAGGLIVQHLVQPLDDGEGATDVAAPDAQPAAADDWNRVRILAATVEDHELLDPALASDRLLFHLFHDEGVRIFSPKPLAVHCRCSRQRVEAFLKSFGREQLADMHEDDGKIAVTCEFCSTAYRFDPESL